MRKGFMGSPHNVWYKIAALPGAPASERGLGGFLDDILVGIVDGCASFPEMEHKTHKTLQDTSQDADRLG